MSQHELFPIKPEQPPKVESSLPPEIDAAFDRIVAAMASGDFDREQLLKEFALMLDAYRKYMQPSLINKPPLCLPLIGGVPSIGRGASGDT